MISLPVGLLMFLAVIIGSAGNIKLSDYMNQHSAIVVLGGTIAVFAIGSSSQVMWAVMRNLLALFRRRRSVADVRTELKSLASNRSSVSTSKDPLIAYALSLWERGVDSSTFQALLSQFRDKLENEDAEAVGALHNLAKYPPALGMMGTVMGMISLFANLGGTNKAGLGPALGVAMTATLYGLLMANGLLNPIADRISNEAIHRKKYFGVVYEILTLINHREAAGMIEEELTNREAA